MVSLDALWSVCNCMAYPESVAGKTIDWLDHSTGLLWDWLYWKAINSECFLHLDCMSICFVFLCWYENKGKRRKTGEADNRSCALVLLDYRRFDSLCRSDDSWAERRDSLEFDSNIAKPDPTYCRCSYGMDVTSGFSEQGKLEG